MFQKMPFGTAVYAMHSSLTFSCVPFIFADSKLAVACDGLKLSHIYIVATLIADVLFEQFLICTAM